MDILQDTNANILHHVRRAWDVAQDNPKKADIVIDLLCSFFRRNEVHEQAITDHRTLAGEALCAWIHAKMKTNL